MVNRRGGFLSSFNLINYDEVPLNKLERAIKLNMVLFAILTTLFFLVGGISTLIVYSFDPVFSVGLFTFVVGSFTIFVALIFIYAKLIWFLRVLAGEGSQESVSDAGQGSEVEEVDYERIY